VITIVLMGTVLIAVMNASIGGIKASSAANDVAQIETVLQNAADRVNRAGHNRCDYDQYIKAAVQAVQPVHWDPDLATASYRWYQAGADATKPGSWETAPDGKACKIPGVPGNEIQLVIIKITNPKGTVSRTIQVVKSDV
jgi:hypothetical protein